MIHTGWPYTIIIRLTQHILLFTSHTAMVGKNVKEAKDELVRKFS